MNKYWLAAFTYVFLILLCAYPIRAQEVKGPKMVLKEQVFDFKEIKEGETIEHTFLVLNQGDQPLEIKKVKPG
jgi:hypothetical protein